MYKHYIKNESVLLLNSLSWAQEQQQKKKQHISSAIPVIICNQLINKNRHQPHSVFFFITWQSLKSGGQETLLDLCNALISLLYTSLTSFQIYKKIIYFFQFGNVQLFNQSSFRLNQSSSCSHPETLKKKIWVSELKKRRWDWKIQREIRTSAS